MQIGAPICVGGPIGKTAYRARDFESRAGLRDGTLAVQSRTGFE